MDNLKQKTLSGFVYKFAERGAAQGRIAGGSADAQNQAEYSPALRRHGHRD